MNEQAFQDLYEEFVNTGYRGSRADFKELLSSNPDAFNDGFQSFVETGYNGTQDDFATLIGVTNPVKKKDSSQQEGGNPIWGMVLRHFKSLMQRLSLQTMTLIK